MQYWFLKSPYNTRTWSDVLASDQFQLYGIRSHAAKNNIAKMQKGDKAIWYCSNANKSAYGIMDVKEEPFQDPTASDNWLSVNFIPIKTFNVPISLEELKKRFNQSVLFLKQPRISVTPLTKTEFETIINMDN